MSQSEKLESKIEELNKNIVELTNVFKEYLELEKNKKSKKRVSTKIEPLDEEEKKKLKKQFDELYDSWLSGKEFDVKKQLDDLELPYLRKLVDAANITQDRKVSKEKIFRLILTRFRERKMLTEGIGEKTV